MKHELVDDESNIKIDDKDDNSKLGEFQKICGVKMTQDESDDDKQQEFTPKLKLKTPPFHLKYAYLVNDSYLVIISSSLIGEMEVQLLQILRKHKNAIAWTVADIKGLSPSIVMHKILMEDDCKPKIQPQRHLNPAMQEMVRKEVVNLLNAGIIYPILDSV